MEEEKRFKIFSHNLLEIELFNNGKHSYKKGKQIILALLNVNSIAISCFEKDNKHKFQARNLCCVGVIFSL